MTNLEDHIAAGYTEEEKVLGYSELFMRAQNPDTPPETLLRMANAESLMATVVAGNFGLSEELCWKLHALELEGVTRNLAVNPATPPELRVLLETDIAVVYGEN